MAKAGDFDFYCEEVLTGRAVVNIVYESEKVLAFYHTKPKYNTHIVVIPKVHALNLIDADSETLTEILKVAQEILKKINVDLDGGRVISNLGKFQDTPHLHFHVISGGDYQDIKLD